jgi:hypothetical protein
VIQPLESGMVRAILVREGQTVRKGLVRDPAATASYAGAAPWVLT